MYKWSLRTTSRGNFLIEVLVMLWLFAQLPEIVL